jgi:hypothetical protein
MLGRHFHAAARLPGSRALGFLLGLVVALTASGCAFGPKVLEQTHGRYYEALRHVEEEQLLRNLLHIRYHEVSGALNVSSIAAQYELSGQAEARPFFIAPNPSNSNVIFKTFTAILPDVLASATNRPTISLNPANDNEAVRQFLSPIPADMLVFLSSTGWPVGHIVRIWIERMNGVPNAVEVGGPHSKVLPDFARFQRVAELLHTSKELELLVVGVEDRAVAASGPLPKEAITAAAVVDAAKNGLEYRASADGKSWHLFRKERRMVLVITPGMEHVPELEELESLLHLVPGQRQYDITVVGPKPDPLRYPSLPSAEIGVETRSTAQVYAYLANGIEIPAEHLSCGLVQPPVGTDGKLFDTREITRGLFAVQVCKGHKPPANAYVAVRYRGYWYYIDDGDATSKAVFAHLLQMSHLNFGHSRSTGGPVLTLPIGR